METLRRPSLGNCICGELDARSGALPGGGDTGRGEVATKPELALALIERVLGDGVEAAPVWAMLFMEIMHASSRVAPTGSGVFPAGRSGKHKGWTEPVPTELKRTRRHTRPGAPASRTLMELGATLRARRLEILPLEAANGQTRKTRIAWMEVYLGHNLRHSGGELEKAWLVIDWPEGQDEAYHYYLAHLHRTPRRARCLTLSRSRWQVEQYYRRSKETRSGSLRRPVLARLPSPSVPQFGGLPIRPDALSAP